MNDDDAGKKNENRQPGVVGVAVTAALLAAPAFGCGSAEEPAEEPVAEETTGGGESQDEEPVADEPVADEPVDEDPAGDEEVAQEEEEERGWDGGARG